MRPDLQIRVRLGAFELDLQTGELCSLAAEPLNGNQFLQEKPFRVLRMLIDRDRELVTRDEIRKTLWPNDTIVDFEHSINVAIGSLRRALGDSATEPRYIQTVPRRGYRLRLPVEWIENGDQRDGKSRTEVVGTSIANPPLTGMGTTLIGKKVSHFRVLELIGGGGMGMVYKAEDLKLGRLVALKLLPEEMAADPVALKRFEREAQTASSLNHPNICTIYGIEEYEKQPVIVMELLAGETLRDRLAASTNRPLPLTQLLEIAGDTCKGLESAHARGIIHRDIKPANLFLTENGPVKILDFGLAKLIQAEDLTERSGTEPIPSFRESPGPGVSRALGTSLSRTGMAMGTASYMSPEQVRKERLDARTDLFSFGLVLYEMAAGQRAFSGDEISAVHEAVLNRDPTPVREFNPEVPPALDAIIARALNKERTARFQSAAEISEALRTVPHQRKVRSGQIRFWLTPALLVTIVLFGVMGYLRQRNRFRLSANDTIVIASLNNQTSDPVLDDALNTALPIEMAQTPFLQVLAPDKTHETLQRLGLPESSRLTPEIARQVCLKTNSKAVVASTISDIGNRYRITLTGTNCRSGKIFARSEQSATLRTQIVHALGIAGTRLRMEMGEPAASLNVYNKPLELATSSSPEALQFLAKAFQHHMSPDRNATIALYQRAIDLDPSMAIAYASLGTVYFSNWDTVRARANEEKAYELRDRLTGQLRFLTETLYFGVGLGDLEKAYPIYQEWVQTFPLDGVAHLNFSGELFCLGRYDQAAAEARDGLRLLSPLGPGNYQTLMTSTVYANRLEEAKSIFEQAKLRNSDTPELHYYRHLVAFLQRDESAMREQVEWLQDRRAKNFAVESEVAVDAYYGRFNDAGKLLRQLMVPKTGTASIYGSIISEDTAMQEMEALKIADAKQLFLNAMPPHPDAFEKIYLAFLYASTNDAVNTDRLMGELDREAPQDTILQDYYLPVIRAELRLQEHDPEGAIQLLRSAEKYELAAPPAFNSLCPAYLRGIAYLQIHKGEQAATEFQKLIDHPAIVGRHVTGALAYLQLGRAEAMSGRKDEARRSYQTFLTIWKNADPDIPIYRQAKAEYQGLTPAK